MTSFDTHYSRWIVNNILLFFVFIDKDDDSLPDLQTCCLSTGLTLDNYLVTDKYSDYGPAVWLLHNVLEEHSQQN